MACSPVTYAAIATAAVATLLHALYHESSIMPQLNHLTNSTTYAAIATAVATATATTITATATATATAIAATATAHSASAAAGALGGRSSANLPPSIGLATATMAREQSNRGSVGQRQHGRKDAMARKDKEGSERGC